MGRFLSPEGGAAATKLAEIAPEELPVLSALLGLAAMKAALAYWNQNHANNSEEFWQKALAERAYVLSQVFG